MKRHQAARGRPIRWGKALAAGESGAVSIFFLCILGALVLFQGVLADLIRIRTAELRMQRALHASLRSSLAAFDRSLLEYGLFGLTQSGETLQASFDRVLHSNATLAEEGAFLRLAGLQLPDSAEIRPLQTLGNPAVIRRQIMETMKYIAPVEFAKELADKLPLVKDQLGFARTYMEQADALEALLAEREEALDRIWSALEQLADAIRGADRSFTGLKLELNRLSARIGNASEERVRERIRELLRELAESSGDESGGSGIRRQLDQQEELLDDIEDFNRAWRQLQEQTDAISRRIQQDSSLLLERLGTARSVNERIQERISGYTAANTDEPGTEAFRQTVVYPAEYFDEIQDALNGLASRFETTAQALAQTNERNRSVTYDREYAVRFEEFMKYQEQVERQRTERVKRVAEQKRQARRQAEEQRKQAAQDGSRACRESDAELYAQLGGKSGLFAKYMRAAGDAGAGQQDPWGQPPESSASFMLDKLQALGGKLAAVRDEMYLHEYALLHLNYRTAETADGHALSGQEIEYLLYGLSSCTANHYAAYGEIFALRLAIRTAEAMVDLSAGAAAASPGLYVLQAVARGAMRGYEDARKLADGEAVPLADKIPQIRWNYKDHLRLFLWFHGSGASNLARLQSLIELNTGSDLTLATTSLRADAEGTLRLWFIPAAQKRYTVRYSNMLSY